MADANPNLLVFESEDDENGLFAFDLLQTEYPSIYSNITTFCRRDVGIHFGKHSLETADIIVVLKDRSSETPRGFMTVKKHKLSWALSSSSETDDRVYYNAPGYLYIDLICSAESRTPGKSGKKAPSGILLLKWLDRYMRDPDNDFIAIGLRAIPTVISLYSKFGWEFIPSCDREVRNKDRVKAAISTLKTASMSKSMNSKDAMKALKYLNKFLPGRLKNHTPLETQIETRNAFEYGNNTSGTAEVYQTDLSNDGYPMVYCKTTPSVLNPDPAPEAEAGPAPDERSSKRQRTAPGKVKSRRKRRKSSKRGKKKSKKKQSAGKLKRRNYK